MKEKEMDESGVTVLIIDDDVDFQMMITAMLNDHGYNVRSMYEGKNKTAVQLARVSDVVLLDIELPGDNGVDIGRHLKSHPDTCDVPIILISAHKDAFTELRESKANIFVHKPFSLSQLFIKINDLLKPVQLS
jgi:two-component system, sensor histidine kinase and response regulator